MLRLPKSIKVAVFAVLTVAASRSVVADSPSGIPAGFTPIFDGVSLDGWHGQKTIHPDKLREMPEEERAANLAQWAEEAAEHWTVDDGVIVNDGFGPFLVTDQEYEDYELYLEYKTVADADSGIYLKDTPQVQIWDVNQIKNHRLKCNLGSGGLWNNSPGAPGKDPLVMADKPHGEWNSVWVRQVGSRTTVVLNDKLVVDHAVMENYWDRSRPLFRSGRIQLQTHGGEICWRNVAIKTLDADAANSLLSDHESVAFDPIFDGETLEGWLGAVDSYEVIDGSIRCKPNTGGNLLTEAQYEDFIVRLEFKLPEGGNNGLAIRSPGPDQNPAYGAMCELQVLDTEHPKYESIDPRQAHGSAYGMVPAHRGFLRATGEWNFQQVTVRGSKVRVELNGYVILDTDLAEVTEFMNDKEHPGKDRVKGHFGFAGHGDAVEFRRLSIRQLGPLK